MMHISVLKEAGEEDMVTFHELQSVFIYEMQVQTLWR